MHKHPRTFVLRYKALEMIDYPNHRVSTVGSVWSLRKGKWRRQKPTDDGTRMLVNLSNENGQKTFSVHRLVLIAFVGLCPEGMEACHNDGNYMNNCLHNLRWDTHRNNERDKVAHGTSNRGAGNWCAKLSEDEVREIRSLYSAGAYSMNQLADLFGVTLGTIFPIIHRRTWKYVY